MKLLTLNFLTCARKTCKASPAAFPLHPREAELEQIEADVNVAFIRNILPRLDWEAMKTLANELGLPNLPDEMPHERSLTTASSSTMADTTSETLDTSQGNGDEAVDADADINGEGEGEPTQILKDLHVLLMEMSIVSGKLACGNCGHEYAVKEGIANFLLPSHMV